MAKEKQATDTAVPADIKKLSFEAALAELEEIVHELETGEGDLDKSIGQYTRGVHLRMHCEAKLKEAEARIEKITIGAVGAVTTEPLDDA